MTAPTENADFLVGSDNFDFINGLGGNDFISGLGADDLLLGSGGDDILSGGRGDDTLNGGNGIDTANYNDDVFAITANLITGKVTLMVNGIDETDTLLSIENITGGGGSDKLTGNAAANHLSGMAGYDTLEGGGGADILDGGDGHDTVTYGGTTGVNVNLATGLGSGGEAEGDTLISIEAVRGWNFNDKLKGNSEANLLDGGAGNDTIGGGGGDDGLSGGLGADVITGGAGIDTIFYHDTSVQIDLLNHTATGGEAKGDTISQVEDISGSFQGDKLFGDDGVNSLAGGFGNDLLNGRMGDDHLFGQGDDDTLVGGIGADELIGGTGKDVMTGGSQSDLFRFDLAGESGTSETTRDLIKDFKPGEDHIGLVLIDANSIASGNQKFDFIGLSAFTGAAGDLRAFFSGANTILEGDVDGNKTADFQIEFIGHLSFSMGDFDL